MAIKQLGETKVMHFYLESDSENHYFIVERYFYYAL